MTSISERIGALRLTNNDDKCACLVSPLVLFFLRSEGTLHSCSELLGGENRCTLDHVYDNVILSHLGTSAWEMAKNIL